MQRVLDRIFLWCLALGLRPDVAEIPHRPTVPAYDNAERAPADFKSDQVWSTAKLRQ
jgi:hypothetical protein